MKKLLLLGGVMLFMAGCGAVTPVEDTTPDVVDVEANSDVVVMISEYQFVFPGTGWYMDFEYADGFSVVEQEGQLVFKLFDGDIVFDYDNDPDELGGGAEFIGQGWWGMQYDGNIVFNTPDKKYYIKVMSDDHELLQHFAAGMTLGK